MSSRAIILSAWKVAIPMSDVLFVAKALEVTYQSNGEFKMMLNNGASLRISFEPVGPGQYPCAVIEISDIP